MMRLHAALLLLAASSTNAFLPPRPSHPLVVRQCHRSTTMHHNGRRRSPNALFISAAPERAEESAIISTEKTMPEVEFPPILEELRDVAMRLHTREQAPKEGRAEAPARPPYVPTKADYLQFLVDSYAVYKVLEDVVNDNEKLERFRNSGMERTSELEKDITWMCKEHDLTRPEVGEAGRRYAEDLKGMVKNAEDIPEFMCHYYNYYFAHLAGGRMIGKQMSKLLLNGETLEFYKWGEDVNALKARVKGQIEDLARPWSRDERDRCVNATADAFRGGGAINGYLYGGSPH